MSNIIIDKSHVNQALNVKAGFHLNESVDVDRIRACAFHFFEILFDRRRSTDLKSIDLKSSNHLNFFVDRARSMVFKPIKFNDRCFLSNANN